MWRYFPSLLSKRNLTSPRRPRGRRVLLQVEPLEGRVVPAYPSVLTLNSLGLFGATANGFENGALAGWSVSGAGDVNGDGFADVIVNAPDSLLEEAYVLFGGAGLGGGTLDLNALGSAGFTLKGTGGIRGFLPYTAQRMSGAGDVNGDGFDDLIVGAPFTNAGGSNRGAAYVVFGGAGLGGSTVTLNALGTGGFTLQGFEDNADAGLSVSGAGTSMATALPTSSSGRRREGGVLAAGRTWCLAGRAWAAAP